MKKTAAPVLAGILALTAVFPFSAHAQSFLGEVPNLPSLFGGSEMFGPIPEYTFPNRLSHIRLSGNDDSIFGPIPSTFTFDRSLSDIRLSGNDDSALGPIPTFERGFLGPIPRLQSDGSFE